MSELRRGSFPQVQVSPIYFDREDVKKAIHAPLDVDWEECSDIDVFPHGDASLPPSFTVLPSIIEKSERSVIVHGLADFILIAEGYVMFMTVRFPASIVNDDTLPVLGSLYKSKFLVAVLVTLSLNVSMIFSMTCTLFLCVVPG